MYSGWCSMAPFLYITVPADPVQSCKSILYLLTLCNQQQCLPFGICLLPVKHWLLLSHEEMINQVSLCMICRPQTSSYLFIHTFIYVFDSTLWLHLSERAGSNLWLFIQVEWDLSMPWWTLPSISSCTSTTASLLLDHASKSFCGGRNTWPPSSWYIRPVLLLWCFVSSLMLLAVGFILSHSSFIVIVFYILKCPVDCLCSTSVKPSSDYRRI